MLALPDLHAIASLPPIFLGGMGASALIGLILGLLLRGGGRRWRQRYEQERDYYAAYREQAEGTFREQKLRIAELENPPAVHPEEPPATVETAAEKLAAAPAAIEEAVATDSVPDHEPVEAVSGEAPKTEVVEAEPATEAKAPVEALVAETPATAEVLAEDHLNPAGPAAVPLPSWAAEPETAAIPIAGESPLADEPTVDQVEADPEPEPATDAVTGGEAAPVENKVPVEAGSAPIVEEISSADTLTRLRGLDTTLAAKLNGLGVTRFEEIEKLSAEDEIALEERLGVPAGFIAREQWRSQAALLRAGNEAEFKERYGLLDA